MLTVRLYSSVHMPFWPTALSALRFEWLRTGFFPLDILKFSFVGLLRLSSNTSQCMKCCSEVIMMFTKPTAVPRDGEKHTVHYEYWLLLPYSCIQHTPTRPAVCLRSVVEGIASSGTSSWIWPYTHSKIPSYGEPHSLWEWIPFTKGSLSCR